MKHRARCSSLVGLVPALLAASALCAVGCDTTIGDGGDSGNQTTSGTGGTGAGGTGAGGTGAGGTGAGKGTGGTGMVDPMSPCNGMTDPRRVAAPQRIVRLTRLELVNTARAYNLIDDATATAIVQDGALGNISDETQRLFPPLATQSETADIDTSKYPTLDGIAERAAKYVFDNFAAVTGCATATDACATTYLTTLATKAYRRPLSADEQTRLTGLYMASKSQTLNGWMVTSTIQQATQNGVYAILVSPHTLWRSEIGEPGQSMVPGTLPLTNHELATQLAYVLTNRPPDDQLRSAADAGTLRTDLMAQTDRLLATPEAKSWLTTVMFTYFRLNTLYNITGVVDWAKFGVTDVNKFLVDMHDESNRFLDHTLWNMDLTGLLTSRTTFLNTNLAGIYGVPAPPGATDTNFVQADLPADQRAGVLTLGAFIVAAAGADRESLVHRALNVKNTMLCLNTPPPPDGIGDQVAAARMLFEVQTAKEQAAYRAMTDICAGCHASFDSYGLVLDSYDNLGKWRTSVTLGDGRTVPVDPTATLPDELGNAEVNGAVEMSTALAQSTAFTNCMSATALQYAMTEIDTASVKAPNGGEPGCAAEEVAGIYTRNSGHTFADLVRATVSSSSFGYRTQAQ